MWRMQHPSSEILGTFRLSELHRPFRECAVHPPAGDRERDLRTLLGHGSHCDEKGRIVLPRRQSSPRGGSTLLEVLQRVDIVASEGFSCPGVELFRPGRCAGLKGVAHVVGDEAAAEDKHPLVAQWRKGPAE